MDREWQETFRNRMRGFEARRAPQPGEAAVSIKVRVARDASTANTLPAPTNSLTAA